YLVEGADDIRYNISNLEDAQHLKILPYQEVEDLLLPLCGDENLRSRLDSLADKGSRVSLLRAKAINILVTRCAEVFMNRQQEILAGTFDRPLMDALVTHGVEHLKGINSL